MTNKVRMAPRLLRSGMVRVGLAAPGAAYMGIVGTMPVATTDGSVMLVGLPLMVGGATAPL